MPIRDDAKGSSPVRTYIYSVGVGPALFSGLVFKQVPLVLLALAGITLCAAIATCFGVIFRRPRFVTLIFLGQATVFVASYLSLAWRHTDANGVPALIALPLLALFGWLSFRGHRPNGVR